jgi:hypothetical protein
MAHDRDERDPYSASAPYPAYDYAPDYYPDPRQYQSPLPNLAPSYQNSFDAPLGRSRTSSNAVRPLNDTLRPQSVHDAVNNAFDNSAAANQLPEEVMRQITEQIKSQVIDSLKKDGFSAAPPSASAPPQAATFPPPPPPPPPAAILRRESPPMRDERLTSPPTRGSGHSSPSPVREEGIRSGQSESFSRDSYASINGDRKSEIRDSKIDMKENLSSRYGDRSDSETVPRRPTITSLKTDDEPTTLEKIWQPLFGVKGEPTERLGQFLRGLAIHIIDDYEPQKSLVITPAKLKRFYEEVKLADDTYPWQNIFRLSNSAIAKIYRDMKIEHFYVQERISDPPVIPALTPAGFQRWMTLHIQAHPQAEFDRLAQAVRNMPINNADNPKERYPKELSRRLLPKYDDLKTRQYTSAALSADGQITIPKHTSFPPPPPQAQSAPPTDTPRGFNDRERMPYGSQVNSHDSAIQSDTDDGGEDESHGHKPSIQIERERKPYIAKEGLGKIYEQDGTASSSSRTLKPETSDSSNKARPRSMFAERVDIGNHSDSSRASDYTAASVPHRSRTYSKSSRRPRSPIANDRSGFVKSDSSVDGVPANYYQSNLAGYERDEERYRNERDRDRSERKDRDDRSERREDRRDRDERERRDRDERREREEREREKELRDKEEYLRRLDEEERRFSRYDGEPLSRRSTVESGYPGPAYGQYPPPLGPGERRYG